MKTMLSGIKSSGQLTLGNYIGALREFVKYQDEYQMFIFIANLHCITVYQNPIELQKNLYDCAAVYLACGLDPKKATVFLQSDVKAHSQLAFILSCYSYMGELQRMTQYKDKVKNTKNSEQNLSVGFFSYPCLMAADILLYDADYVPVGEDQKQHVEITRDIANRFNNKYGPTFFVPECLNPKVGARIMSLSDPTKKMSKSDIDGDKGCIYLLDDLTVARKKIMAAVTDNYAKINYDPKNQAGISNLLTILASLNGQSIEETVAAYQDYNYGNFKAAVADRVCVTLADIQAKYQEIIASGTLHQTFAAGAKKASAIAEAKLAEVQRKIGLEIF